MSCSLSPRQIKHKNSSDKKAILVYTGSFNPVHRGHFSAMQRGVAVLKGRGYDEVTVLISPSHDIHVKSKIHGLQTQFASFKHRVAMIKRAMRAEDRSWLILSLWEGQQDSFVDSSRVVEECARPYGNGLARFHLCGEDHYHNRQLSSKDLPHDLVVIPRFDGREYEKAPAPEVKHLVLWASNENPTQNISSTNIRSSIAYGKPAEVQDMIVPGVMEYIEEHTLYKIPVFALVATVPSRMLNHLHKALQSVAAQKTAVDYLVIVVDLPPGEGSLQEREATANTRVGEIERLLGNLFGCNSKVKTEVLVNKRTKNMSGSGCWNTGIMTALALEERAFVAVCDDDDEWRPSHICRCLQVATDSGAAWVVSGIERREGISCEAIEQIANAETLTQSEFLRGNPGVQGSNLFVSLALLQRAGLFDENLDSMTDRDLCLRLPTISIKRPFTHPPPQNQSVCDHLTMYAKNGAFFFFSGLLEQLGDDHSVEFTHTTTVIHNAERDRDRVTTSKRAKHNGAQKFLRKHSWRFSRKDREAFIKRCREKFDVDVEAPSTVTPLENFNLQTLAGDEMKISSMAFKHLNTLIERVEAQNSHCGKERHPIQGLFGVISSDVERLTPLLRDISCLPSHVRPFVMIFVTQTNLSTKPFRNALADCGLLDKCRVISATDGAAMAIADQYYCVIRHSSFNNQEIIMDGEPRPIGVARTILQAYMAAALEEEEGDYSDCEFAVVVDDDKRLPTTFLSDSYIFEMDRSMLYLGRDFKTAPNTVTNGLRVQLLDIWFSLVSGNCQGTYAERPDDSYYDLSSTRFDHLEEPQWTRLGDDQDLASLRNRVLKGDPLTRDCLPPIEEKETNQRGGCLLLFRENFPRLASPQFVPEISQLKNKHNNILSRRSDSVWLIGQSQSCSCVAFPGLFVIHDNVRDNIRTCARARLNALAEACGSTVCRDCSDRESYLSDRLCAMSSNNERIRGLLNLLRGLKKLELSSLLDDLDALMDPKAWEVEVFQPLRSMLHSPSFELLDWSPEPLRAVWNDGACIVNAFLSCSKIVKERPLIFVGAGNEGVVLRADNRCYKFYRNPDEEKLEYLSLQRVLNCVRENKVVLSYDYVEGKMFKGGSSQKLQIMLRDMWKKELIMTNIKPRNLIIADTVKIVDLGRDWSLEFSVELFKSMCRRAFLSSRFGGWCASIEGEIKLQKLLRLERDENSLPELSGFEHFFKGCCQDGALPFLDKRSEEIAIGGISTRESYTASLMIKTCLMEAGTLVANVRHIVWTVQATGTEFKEIILTVDRTRRSGLARQHTKVDEGMFDHALDQVRREGLVDRVLNFDGLDIDHPNRRHLQSLNKKYLGVSNSFSTHSEDGTPHGAFFFALENINSDLVLQLDSDIRLNISGKYENLIHRAAKIFRRDERAITTSAVPIYNGLRMGQSIGIDGFATSDGKPFRFEIRCSFLHLPRFRERMLPLNVPHDEFAHNIDSNTILKRGWYRVFDRELELSGLRSYRFFSNEAFFVHPPNSMKGNEKEYLLIADRLSSPDVVRNTKLSASLPLPAQKAWYLQSNKVDAVEIDYQDSNFFGERAEWMIFVCCGHNLTYGRAKRCLDSLSKQIDVSTVGVVVVDDGSENNPYDLFTVARSLFPGCVTCIYTGVRMGTMFVKNHVIKRVCINPKSIIVTLDLDDRLLGKRVIEKVKDVFFANGLPTKYLVALGGMVRDSKYKTYKLDLSNPRHSPFGGNVWKHLRCFKKFLFDAIGEENFKGNIGGEIKWVEHGVDWAFMIPIIEQAGSERVYELSDDEPLYLYEESTAHSRDEKHTELEKTKQFLQELPLFSLCDESTKRFNTIIHSHCHMPIDIPNTPCVGFKLTTFKASLNGVRCMALVRGDPKGATQLPVRIHSECFTGDVLGSKRCDCGEQLRTFRDFIGSNSKGGVLLYVMGHEGRGNGLEIKMKEYSMQDDDSSKTHIELLHQAGGETDKREYAACADILLNVFGIQSVELYTNNIKKLNVVSSAFGKSNVTMKTMQATVGPDNRKYLQEKVKYLEHDPSLIHGDAHGAVNEVNMFIKDLMVDEDFKLRSHLPPPSHYHMMEKCIRRMLEHKPFHNLGILNSYCTGGTCADHNIFLSSVLEELGFCVRLIGANTRLFREKPESQLCCDRGISLTPDHICLLVQQEGRGKQKDWYLVDVGNGSPYFSPLLVHKECSSTVEKHANLQYRLRYLDKEESYALEHLRNGRKEWRENYRFHPTEGILNELEVKKIIDRHKEDPHHGHMLRSLRLNRWRLQDTSIVLRDCSAKVIYPNGYVKSFVLQNGHELADFVAEHFPENQKELKSAAPILIKYLKCLDKDCLPLAALAKSYVEYHEE